MLFRSHTEFLNAGYPAVRLSVAVENYDWQHQDVRVEQGKAFGDTIDHMDFAYLAKVTKLNVAAVAAIASAPLPSEPTIEGAVSTNTTLTWKPRGAASYRVSWRRTDASNWDHKIIYPFSRACTMTSSLHPGDGLSMTESFDGNCKAVLPHVRVDDWVFGVSSVSADGFESPVASAVPGGAFKPYVALPAKP